MTAGQRMELSQSCVTIEYRMSKFSLDVVGFQWHCFLAGMQRINFIKTDPSSVKFMGSLR